MSEKMIKTGELSQNAGVNKESIRFYERKGLLRKPQRTSGGYRLYSQSDVKRVLFIKNAQTLGFSLKEIRELLDIADGNVVECGEVREIAQRKLDFVRGRISDLQKLETVLRELIRKCARSRQVNGCPIIESISGGIREHED